MWQQGLSMVDQTAGPQSSLQNKHKVIFSVFALLKSSFYQRRRTEFRLVDDPPAQETCCWYQWPKNPEYRPTDIALPSIRLISLHFDPLSPFSHISSFLYPHPASVLPSDSLSALLLQRIEDTAETKAASIPAEPAGRREGARDQNEARRKRKRAKSEVDGRAGIGGSCGGLESESEGWIRSRMDVRGWEEISGIALTLIVWRFLVSAWLNGEMQRLSPLWNISQKITHISSDKNSFCKSGDSPSQVWTRLNSRYPSDLRLWKLLAKIFLLAENTDFLSLRNIFRRNLKYI